jgi:hypothetical protein
MVLVLWATTHAGTVVQPQATSFGLFLWHFQPLTTPDAFHALVVDVPALITEQRGDVPIAITAVLAGQVDNSLRQSILVIAHDQRAALCRSGLPQNAAGPPLRDCQLLLHVPNCLPASFGA